MAVLDTEPLGSGHICLGLLVRHEVDHETVSGYAESIGESARRQRLLPNEVIGLERSLALGTAHLDSGETTGFGHLSIFDVRPGSDGPVVHGILTRGRSVYPDCRKVGPGSVVDSDLRHFGAQGRKSIPALMKSIRRCVAVPAPL